MGEPEEQKEKSFWTSLPGVLTGLAGVLGAIAAVIGLFVVPGGSDGGDSGASHSEWVQQADQLCSQTNDLVRQLPPIDTATFSNAAPVLQAAARNLRSLAEKLRALDAPEEDQQKIAQLTGLMDQQANEGDAEALAFAQGDIPGIQLHDQQLKSLDPQISAAAQALGASACAQSPTPTGV